MAQGDTPQLFPADQSTNVNVDTQLVLTFAAPPTIGAAGFIRVFDAQQMHPSM